MKRTISFILGICIHLTVLAVTQVSIPDPDTWRYTDLKKYIGQTVQFDVPFYVCNNYNSITISPRRTYSPTNQALPLSAEYNSILSLNSQGSVTLTGVSGYHRLGERLHNLTVKVNSQTSVSLVSCDWRGNTRKELEKGVDLEAINMRGEHTLLVCCMNLEYYLVENLGSGSMGPKTREAHQKQRAKVSEALAKINADLYGFVEIELGQSALAELASDLTKNTGRTFAYIDDGSSAKGTYTKAGYVYCSEVLEPHGGLRYNDEGVDNRKKTQAFREKATGEIFLYSVNHFKAKSGKGSGDNADKGDGQGAFNGDRVREAKSVLNHYDSDSYYYGDKDILIMGDLNAYAMEDPITVLREGGMIDLHRVFHADSSYSYVYHGQAGYLDHALCNETLYPHVTGMVAYHINSDESDSYTYDKSNDQSMFRSSDHDPVLVGLRLDTTYTAVPGVSVPDVSIGIHNFTPYIYNAEGGHYIVYRIDGIKVKEQSILSNQEEINGLDPGLYILNIYGQGKCHKMKIWFK
jgi:predicted extracellular nuclease